MCTINNCCVFFNLRNGCILISVLNIIISLASLSLGWLKNDNFFKANLPVLITEIILVIVLAIVLLIGVLTSRSIFILFYMNGVIIYIIIRSGIFLHLLVKEVGVGTPRGSELQSAVDVIIRVLLLAHICLDIYFTVVIGSFYQSLKPGHPLSGLPDPV